MDNDSDEELEDITFLSKASKSSAENLKPTHSSRRNLDELLAEHRHSVNTQETLDEIEGELEESHSGTYENDQDDLKGTEYEIKISKLDVKILHLPTSNPCQDFFLKERRCCLFGESIRPCDFGFLPATGAIESLLAKLNSSETLTSVLSSRVICSCFNSISNPICIQKWLFYLMSIHTDPLMVNFCYINLSNIIQQLTTNSDVRNKIWWPKPQELFQVLVNLGASPNELSKNDTFYNTKDSEILKPWQQSLDIHGQESRQDDISTENVKCLLNALSLYLQSRSSYSNEELQFFVFMVMKMSLDVRLNGFSLIREFQVCIASLLHCYQESEWSKVVPELSDLMSTLTSHHHTAVYLCQMLPFCERGLEIQRQMSFCWLSSFLNENKELRSSSRPTLKNILNLGSGQFDDEDHSKLGATLKEILKSDTYKLRSLIYLLDMAAGDEIHRKSQSREHLEYLVHEMKDVNRSVRDSIRRLDFSEIKEKLTRLVEKWQHTKNTKKIIQRTIFSSTSLSHVRLKEEILKDSNQADSSDEMDSGL